MAKVSVRAANEHDLPSLLTINEQVQALHFAARPDQFKPVDTVGIERWLLEILDAPAVTAWVAELEGAVVGSAIVTRHERAEGPFVWAQTWWSIDQLGVLPAYRRRGVAKPLVARIEAEASAQCIARIELNSWAFNTDAHAAFGKLGFAPKHIRFELGASKDHHG